MPRSRKTAFDRYVAAQMESPTFARECADSRREVDAVDQIVRALDSVRVAEGMSKAELARAISAKPETVRRLFTKASPNPTLATVVGLAEALGYRLELVPQTPGKHRGAQPRSAARRTRAASSASVE